MSSSTNVSSLTSGEGIVSEPKYPSEDPKQGPFSFGASGFLVHHLPRETSNSLRKLLFPELLASTKARKSAWNDLDIVTASWVKDQLYHYGIDFTPDIDPFKAKALLLTSVAHGLCDVVPPQILEIKMKLKGEYDAMMKKYQADFIHYRVVAELPRRMREFELCATPTEEAQCDASLFLRKYFLNEEKQPDRSKTPGLMLLKGYKDRGLALCGRTDRVPALHVADGGLGGERNVMVIGWDRVRVNEKAIDIDMEQSHGRGVLRPSQDWENLMERHYNYTADYSKLPLKAGDSAKLIGTCGVYALMSDPIQHDWPTLSKEMRLRKFSGALAIFDLGIVTGMMVFAGTQECLAEVLSNDSFNAEYSEAESEEELEDDASTDEEEIGEETDEELQSEPSDISDVSMGDESDNESLLSPESAPKRQKLVNNNPGRLYFQWRGYNTQSGAIQLDPDNNNTGYIDFANQGAARFEGIINMPAFGGVIPFQGYKIPGMSGPVTMNWNELSHLASERAKAPERYW